MPANIEILGFELPFTYNQLYSGVVTLIFFTLLGFILKSLIYRYGVRALPKKIAESISKTSFYIMIFIGVLGLLGSLGVDPTSLVVAGGIAGLAIGFASRTVVSNLLSGLFLYIDRPIKEGDPVEVEGVGGVVEDINILSTRITSWDGVFHRIPNEKVFTTIIKNFSKTTARRVEYKIGISYSSDVDKAREIIYRVIDEEPLALVEPGPQVFLENLGEYAQILAVRFWAPTPQWFTAKTKVLQRIKEAFDREGIEIPYPHRIVFVREERS